MPVDGVLNILAEADVLPSSAAFLMTLLIQWIVALRLRIPADLQRMGHTTAATFELNLASRFYALFIPGGNLTAVAIRVMRLGRLRRHYAGAIMARSSGLLQLFKYVIKYLIMSKDTPRELKDRLYGQFARIGKALSSPHRLEILELLAQGERAVDSLAGEMGMSIANTSQHLKALRQAALVESRRDGLFVHYRLADPMVYDLCRAIRTVAENRLAEFDRLVRDHFGDRSGAEAVPMDELMKRARSKDVVILDTRPANEYAAGHIAGAISVPVDDLQRRLRQLPKGKEYVAYCRGPYCVYADRAVEMLRAKGRRARRLLQGFPEWRAAGFPVEVSTLTSSGRN